MATTPNYGWVMPDPTDFVTNLPADFEVFGDAVDADLAGLLGGTAGQVLVKNSGTDHDFDFAVDPVQDKVTTAGDLLYGTAADTLGRLGIGTAGQVLRVNSGATAPEWATPAAGGGLTQIATQAMSGLSSVTFGSIPQTYKYLVIIGTGLYNGTADQNVILRINNVTTGSVYNTTMLRNNSATVTNFGASDGAVISGSSTTTNQTGGFHCTIPYYTINNTPKAIFSQGGQDLPRFYFTGAGSSGSNAEDAITRLDITGGGAYTFSGGTITLYGVN